MTKKSQRAKQGNGDDAGGHDAPTHINEGAAHGGEEHMNEQTNAQAITIQGLEFTVPAPYAEGYVLKANEASALNQLLAENLRNNFASKVKAAKEAGVVDVNSPYALTEGEGDDAKTVDHDSLQSQLSAYAGDYEFGVRRTRTSEPADPIEREARRIADEQVRHALKAKNIKVKDLAEGKFDELVAARAAKEEVIAEAKRRVDMRTSIGADELDIAV